MSESIAESILEATRVLQSAGIAEARREAGSLLERVIDRDRTFIISHAEQPLTSEQSQIFRNFVARRARGEPLQYITGIQAFFGLDFEVTTDVLIPRPETELLVERALELIDDRQTAPLICDVGTGSGCITIALLHELPHVSAVALDASPLALGVARRNAARHAVTERVTFFESDCYSGLSEENPRFDLIVSNPPYIATEAIATLQTEVRDHEPRLALAAGPDGLQMIKRLISESGYFLKQEGQLLIEIGFDQAAAVENLINLNKWKLVGIHKDLQGIPRLAELQKP
ncbi:MAG: peptide chain release factor N(5)-glutamine methyltransferase [Acidobacteriota bacterium]